MTPTRILVATTRGPSAVQRLTAEDEDVRSVICLDGKAMSLPVSGAYDQFVRQPTGLVERHFGHGSYRLDVEHPIDDGASWQLGVFLAHALEAAGALAGRGIRPARLVWATGEVDRDLAIRPVAHVAEKMERSEAAIRSAVAEGVPVLVMLPRANAREAAPAWLAELMGKVRVVPLDSALDACRELGVPLDGVGAAKEDAAPPQRRRLPSFLAISIMSLAAVLTALAWILFGAWERPSPPIAAAPPAPSAPRDGDTAVEPPLQLGLAELRMSGGGDCPAEAGQSGLVATALTIGHQGRFPDSRLAGLCGLKFTVRSRDGGRHLWAFAQMVPERVFLLAETRSLEETAAARDEDASWTVLLPPGRTKPLSYVFVAMSSPQPLAEAAALLPRRIDWSGAKPFNEEFKALALDLERRGITTAIAAHELLP